MYTLSAWVRDVKLCSVHCTALPHGCRSANLALSFLEPDMCQKKKNKDKDSVYTISINMKLCPALRCSALHCTAPWMQSHTTSRLEDENIKGHFNGDQVAERHFEYLVHGKQRFSPVFFLHNNSLWTYDPGQAREAGCQALEVAALPALCKWNFPLLCYLTVLFDCATHSYLTVLFDCAVWLCYLTVLFDCATWLPYAQLGVRLALHL